MQHMPGKLSSIEHGKVQVHQHSASTSMAYARHRPLLLQKTRLSCTHLLLLKVPHSLLTPQLDFECSHKGVRTDIQGIWETFHT